MARLVAGALHEVDLSPAQYRVMCVLSEGDSMASDMAGRMAVTKPSMSALIDGLEQRGLVERHLDPADRRRRSLCLTPEGRRVLDAADEVTGARMCDLAAHLSGDASQALDALAAWGPALTSLRTAHFDQRGAEPR